MPISTVGYCLKLVGVTCFAFQFFLLSSTSVYFFIFFFFSYSKRWRYCSDGVAADISEKTLARSVMAAQRTLTPYVRVQLTAG